jgi:hypothetical protein
MICGIFDVYGDDELSDAVMMIGTAVLFYCYGNIVFAILGGMIGTGLTSKSPKGYSSCS